MRQPPGSRPRSGAGEKRSVRLAQQKRATRFLRCCRLGRRLLILTHGRDGGTQPRQPPHRTMTSEANTYAAAPAISVTENPQFIAMKIASVAPSTDSAPFMPHAHGTSDGRWA